ncbi:hypothetical protein CSKR_201295 [Clonorchis sinensis]|uniref:Uncharacterized protein n=1 Tax=Clonorchis sinensis TaxID=79923 RepID=A0A8T1MPP9_CLOSI|nr:hypothetical protein CSKR_201295 [Clonorchis sinensis]
MSAYCKIVEKVCASRYSALAGFLANIAVIFFSALLHAMKYKGVDLSFQLIEYDLLTNKEVYNHFESLLAWKNSLATYIHIPGIGINTAVMILNIAHFIVQLLHVTFDKFFPYQLSAFGTFVVCVLFFFSFTLVCYNLIVAFLLALLPAFWLAHKTPELSDYINFETRQNYYLLLIHIILSGMHIILTVYQLPLCCVWKKSRPFWTLFKMNPPGKLATVKLDTGTCSLYPMQLYCTPLFRHRRQYEKRAVGVMTEVIAGPRNI